MANSAEILKEFLISLGFAVDKSSEQKFSDSVAKVTVKVVALGSAVVATASAITAGVAKIADEFEKLYFASRRTNTSVENMQALGYAAANMGSSAEAASGSLESLARFLRNSPGAEGLLKNIGVQTRDANGNLRDTGDLINDLGKTFSDMPYYRANAYAQALGIDEKTLMAMRENMGEFEGQYKAMLSVAGLDAQKAAESGHEFMVELRSLGAAFTVLTQKVAAGLSGSLANNLKKLREVLTANFGRIAGVISNVLNIVLRLSGAIGELVFRGIQVLESLADWFGGLSDSTRTLLKWLGIVAVAWKVLNAGFLATPLGIITTLITSLVLLWDDYQTWKEGGKSLIDWKAWAPGIEAAISGIKNLRSIFSSAIDAMREAIQPFMPYVEKLINGLGKLARWTGLKLSNKAADEKIVPPTAAQSSPIDVNTAKAAVKNNQPGNVLERGLLSLQKMGWSKEQSAGIIANLKRESQLNPNAAGDSGAAFGIAQWHPDRQEKFKEIFGKDIHQATFDEQLQFVNYELTQGGERKAGTLLKAAKNAQQAGMIVSQHYERPRDVNGEAALRGASAADIDKKFNPYVSELASVTPQGAAAAQNNAATINQTTNITVTGSTDPTATSKDISVAQNNVNERLVRNMRSAVFQ